MFAAATSQTAAQVWPLLTARALSFVANMNSAI